MNPKESVWYMYVVVCLNDSYYCGITTNLERRLKQHNGVISGGAKYTRSRRPCKLIYSEVHANRSEASKAEYKFKKLTKLNKIKYINK